MLRRTILFVSLLALVTSSVAVAQNFGRIVVVVKDAKGEPVQGVTVTATCTELPRFHETATTSKKGRATISVIDATKIYQFRIEAEGYPPLDVPMKPEIRQTIQREVTLNAGMKAPSSAEMGMGDPMGGGEIVFTPAQRLFNEGVEALKASDYPTAEAKFKESMEKDSELAEPHSAVAGLYLYQKNWAGAIAAANKYIELAGDNPRAYRILYEAYRESGDAAKAEESLEALKRLDAGGDTVAMLYNEGVAALQVGDNPTAKARFMEALELKPDLETAIKPLAIAHILLKEYPEAIAMADRALVAHPEDHTLLKIRYDSYKALGDEAMTAEAFQALAAVDPTTLSTQIFDEALVAFNGGDMDGAIDAFNRVLEVDPSYAKAHYHLGLAYVNRDAKAEAREHLQAFIEKAPDDPDAAVAREMLSYLGN